VTFFFAASAAAALRSGLAAGVKGSLKGCAADVDVALGGVCEDVESPWRGAVCVAVVAEMGVAFLKVGVVLRKRGVAVWGTEGFSDREAARRQERHIILGVGLVGLNWWVGVGRMFISKVLRWALARGVSPVPNLR
jgi:hypothetical protein